MANENYINHVGVLLDASTSMGGRQDEVIKAVDNQIKYLARRSVEMNQETRVSIYVFSDSHRIKCVIFDKDVLRLPSIKDLYQVYGNTALVDATLLAIEDLEMTPVKYGDHSFLIFVFTDGEENNSRRRGQLAPKLASLGPNWTVAALVPDINAKLEAQRFGFQAGNIAIWDVSSITGIEEAMTELQVATDNYMTLRSTGVTGTRTLFSTDASAVNASTIKAAGLKPMAKGTYDLLTVPKIKAGQGTLNKDKKPVWELMDFVAYNGLKFSVGRNYYRLSKQELINGDKDLAVREKATNKVFVGAGVRAMIGLSDKNQRVAPDANKDFDIFVQSKSSNRHLFQGDEILVLK